MTAQNGVLELLLDGVWTAVPLYAAAGSTVTRGLPPDGSWPRPATIECEINNDDLAYDPARPESPLYGVAGRNTPARYTANGNTRLWAEASSWRPERTQEHQPGAGRGRSWTKFTAEGVLRRIGKWTDPLRSPMYRTISGRATSIGHWPLEDGRDALRLATSTPLGQPGFFRGGAALAESEAPLGAEQAVKVTATSQLSGRWNFASTTAGWQVCFSFRLPAVPGSGTYANLFRWTTSNGWTWAAQVNNVSYNFVITDAAGATVNSFNVGFGTGAEPDKWITMRIRVVQSGGNVDMQPAWYQQSDPVVWGTTAIFAGTAGALRQWWQDGSATLDGAHFSHVFGVTGVSDNLLAGPAIAAINGHQGETAYDRFGRLCDELGITRYMIGNSADTQLMGPQRAATFLQLLREIRATDDCRIDDERFDLALTLRTRRSMIAQSPALVLTWPADVAVPFARIIDDQPSGNVITVKNASGGEVTATQLDGPMSVQPPPDGVGAYPQTVDVSVANPAVQLPDIASWHRAKGTLERPRYEEVTVDLLASPSLEAAVSAVREGDYIRVDGAEPDPVHLLVDGIVQRVGKTEHTVMFLVELYDPYRVGVYDTTAWRWDAKASALVTARTTANVAWTVDSTDPADVWSQNVPYDWTVEGERVTVQEVSMPGSVAVDLGQFEIGTANWAAAGGALAQSAAQKPYGTKSALITVAGAPVQATLRTQSAIRAPVVAGKTYRLEFNLYSSIASANVNGVVNWFNGAGTFLSSSGLSLSSVPANTWTRVKGSGLVAPAGAAGAEYGPTVAGNPPNGTLLYLKGVDLVDEAAAAASIPQKVIVARSVNGVVKAQAAAARVRVYESRRWGL